MKINLLCKYNQLEVFGDLLQNVYFTKIWTSFYESILKFLCYTCTLLIKTVQNFDVLFKRVAQFLLIIVKTQIENRYILIFY